MNNRNCQDEYDDGGDEISVKSSQMCAGQTGKVRIFIKIYFVKKFSRILIDFRTLAEAIGKKICL
jgi:hypothetical protein